MFQRVSERTSKRLILFSEQWHRSWNFFFVPEKELSFSRFLHNQNLQLLWFQKLNFWAANQLETRETHNILRNKTVSCLWGWRGGGEGVTPLIRDVFLDFRGFSDPTGCWAPTPCKKQFSPPWTNSWLRPCPDLLSYLP